MNHAVLDRHVAQVIASPPGSPHVAVERRSVVDEGRQREVLRAVEQCGEWVDVMRPPFAVADRAVPEAVRKPPLADRVEQRILCEGVYERFEKAAVANLAVGVEQEDKACVRLPHPLVESGTVE